METKYSSLEEAFEELGWQHIHNDDDIWKVSKIFDVTKLDSDGCPKITTNRSTIIITDNIDWNETSLLIDIISAKFIEMYGIEKKTECDFVYIDNIKTRALIDNVDYESIKDKLDREESRKAIEKFVLKNALIVVNPKIDLIVRFTEGIAPISFDNPVIDSFLKLLLVDHEPLS